MWYEVFINKGIIPEGVVRFIVRLILGKYAGKVAMMNENAIKEIQKAFLREASQAPIALGTHAANQQHYEIDTSFYRHILGQSLKYSGSVWPEHSVSLDKADRLTLDLYLKRAHIQDSQRILELGSGWGSMSLHIAGKFPNAKITTVTNSESQKEYIETKATDLGFANLSVVHTDINDFKPIDQYDRVVSIEMFEHLRNPGELINRIEEWLQPGGKLFIQVFSHQKFPQYFDDIETSWMARNFFTGGMMPYDGFYEQLVRSLTLSRKWWISGLNYHISLEAWLQNLRELKATSCNSAQNIKSLGTDFYNKYAIFLIICSELFRYNEGKDWYLIHYLFNKPFRKGI